MRNRFITTVRNYNCEECETAQPESAQPKSAKQTNSNEKQCIITVTQTDMEPDQQESLIELEKENKKLKLELCQIKELKKELKREREIKDKVLADRTN